MWFEDKATIIKKENEKLYIGCQNDKGKSFHGMNGVIKNKHKWIKSKKIIFFVFFLYDTFLLFFRIY